MTESPRRLLQVASPNDPPTLNESNAVVRHLSSDQSEELIAIAKHHLSALKIFEWQLATSEASEMWQSDLEHALNQFVWMNIFCDWRGWFGNTGPVLESAGFAAEALACLDEDDRSSLERRLVESSENAFDHGLDLAEESQEALTQWLQDWTDSDDPCLNNLIELVQRMTAKTNEALGFDWSREGF